MISYVSSILEEIELVQPAGGKNRGVCLWAFSGTTGIAQEKKQIRWWLVVTDFSGGMGGGMGLALYEMKGTL